jgi:hypothetical protein
MQTEVTLKELIDFSKEMAHNYPNELVNLNSEYN